MHNVKDPQASTALLDARGERIKNWFRLRDQAEFLAPPVLLKCVVAFQCMTPPRRRESKVVSR